MVSLVALAEHGSRLERSVVVASTQSTRPRSINRSAGHALEILGHAIEYLTDEYVQRGATDEFGTGQLEAIQVLMAVNRAIYFDCPEKVNPIDRLSEICRSVFAKHRSTPNKAA